MTNIQFFFALMALFIGSMTLLITWKRWRQDQLRKNEVLSWADECVDVLQSIFLVSHTHKKFLNEGELRKIRFELSIKTSVLIERGRFFFRNEVSDDWGNQKPKAYRGYRPRILDHLVIGYQIVTRWPNKNEDEINKRSALALETVQNFVSLAQAEIGRDKVASAEAIKGGDHIELSILMVSVEPIKDF
jgi:hypothetical protein